MAKIDEIYPEEDMQLINRREEQVADNRRRMERWLEAESRRMVMDALGVTSAQRMLDWS
jgi:hypothetical protein